MEKLRRCNLVILASMFKELSGDLSLGYRRVMGKPQENPMTFKDAINFIREESGSGIKIVIGRMRYVLITSSTNTRVRDYPP